MTMNNDDNTKNFLVDRLSIHLAVQEGQQSVGQNEQRPMPAFEPTTSHHPSASAMPNDEDANEEELEAPASSWATSLGFLSSSLIAHTQQGSFVHDAEQRQGHRCCFERPCREGRYPLSRIANRSVERRLHYGHPSRPSLRKESMLRLIDQALDLLDEP